MGNPLAQLLDRLETGLALLVRVAIATLLALMVVIVAYQVTSRLTGWLPFMPGTEELARGLFIWVVLLGAALGVHDGTHFAVEMLPLEGEAARRIVETLVAVVIVVGAVVLLVQGWHFAGTGLARRSLATGLPAIWAYLAIAVGGGLMTIFGLRLLVTAAIGHKTQNQAG